MPSFSFVSTASAYRATPFCFNSARAVSTESTPVAFFTHYNSLFISGTIAEKDLPVQCEYSPRDSGD